MVQKRRWQDEEACIDTAGNLAALWSVSTKRNCLQDSQGPAALECNAPCAESLNWLHQLASMSGHQDVFTARWLRCAELNVLFTSRRYFASLQGHSLKSYHSYTRSSRETVWNRLCSSSGLDPQQAAAAANGIGPAPEHMQMLGFVMSKLFHQYPEAGAVRYTFVKPPWMFGWSSKWKHLQPEISVVEVRAFPGAHGGAMSIFVPVLP